MPQRRSIFRGPDPEWADKRGIGEGPRPASGPIGQDRLGKRGSSSRKEGKDQTEERDQKERVKSSKNKKERTAARKHGLSGGCSPVRRVEVLIPFPFCVSAGSIFGSSEPYDGGSLCARSASAARVAGDGNAGPDPSADFSTGLYARAGL